MKTIRIAGKRVPLTALGKEGEIELMGATVQVKGLGKVIVRVERTDPEKFKKLTDYLAEPKTAVEIQKQFALKTWSAAGRLIDSAKAAGVKVFISKSAPTAGRMGRHPMLFSSRPILVPPPAPKTEKMDLAAVLSQFSARLESIEHRLPPASPPQGMFSPPPPPPPPSH